MTQTLLKYTFGAVALYLGVAYATGGGKLLDSAFKGYASSVKALQGRG